MTWPRRSVPPGPVKLATLEPVTLAVKGTANAADLRVILRTGELRWDLPDWGQELPVNTAALTVTYDATYRGQPPASPTA